MRFDSFKSLISFLGALGNQGYQVPFKDYEKDFKDNGFDKHIHCYNFDLSFYEYKGIYDNSLYFILKTQDNNKFYSIAGVMTKKTIEERLRTLLLAYVKFEIPFNIGKHADELLKLLGDDKGGSTYGD